MKPDIIIDYMQADIDGVITVETAKLPDGTNVSDHVVVGDDDAEPAVARILEVGPDRTVIRILPGSAEENADLLVPPSPHSSAEPFRQRTSSMGPPRVPLDDIGQALEVLEGPGTLITDLPMSHLPPVGWADVATKRDLGHLGESLRHQFALTRSDMQSDMNALRAELQRDMNSQTKTLFFSLAGLILTVGVAALQLV